MKLSQSLISDIQRLKSSGLYTTSEIARKLNISINQCNYVLYVNVAKRKEWSDNRNKKLRSDPYYALKIKVNKFKSKNGRLPSPDYSHQDVIDKFSGKEVCYLTGQKIDIKDGKSYHLDHIVPSSKGGTNQLDNMQLCSKYANFAKNDLDIESLLKLCEQIIAHVKPLQS